MGFLLGYSQQEITPDIPFQMAGYRPLRSATGIHDPLYVRCILLQHRQNKTITALIQFDLIAVDHLIIDRTKKELKESNIHIDNFVFSATHTHSGPAGVLNTMKGALNDMSEFFGTPNLTLINTIATSTITAIKEAMTTWHRFRVEMRQTTFNNIGSIREDKSSRTDPHILMIRFLLENNKQLLLYNFACQASVLGKSNQLVSADFPYSVISHDRDQDMVMFLNGNAGNINTKTITKSDTYEQADEFGRQIAYEIAILLKHPDYIGKLENLSIKTYQVTLKRKEVESFQNLKDTTTLNYQIIRFQHLTIVTLPVEVTSDVMEELKEKHNIECICYTNGYELIMTTKNSFDQQSYEALMSPFQKGEAEKLVSHISQNL